MYLSVSDPPVIRMGLPAIAGHDKKADALTPLPGEWRLSLVGLRRRLSAKQTPPCLSLAHGGSQPRWLMGFFPGHLFLSS